MKNCRHTSKIIVLITLLFFHKIFLFECSNGSIEYNKTLRLTNESKVTNNLSHKNFPQHRKDINYPPMIYFSGGCEGSSATGTFLKMIISEFTGQSMFPVKLELLQIHKNPIYQKLVRQQLNNDTYSVDLMLMSIGLYQMKAMNQNSILLLKACDFVIQKYPGLLRQLAELYDARVTYIYRKNFLDSCICSVRDCFGPEYGYPVLASNGSRTDLCFERREGKIETKVKLLHPHKCILWRKNRAISNQKLLRSMLPNIPFVSTEALFAFQYSNKSSDWTTSVSNWMKLMEPLFPNEDLKETIENVLIQKQNTRKAAPPNVDVLDNKDFVIKQQELQNSLISHYLVTDQH